MDVDGLRNAAYCALTDKSHLPLVGAYETLANALKTPVESPAQLQTLCDAVHELIIHGPGADPGWTLIVYAAAMTYIRRLHGDHGYPTVPMAHCMAETTEFQREMEYLLKLSDVSTFDALVVDVCAVEW